ncbi:MAG: TonB-dependent receptor [Deltaproteobacteria bacterium]|nr:TonB-dependent receptor [Deltaproteobacteria bacterium]
MQQKLKLWTFSVIVCGLFAAPQTLPAAEQADAEPGVYTLGEIVISGKTEGVQASESVYTVTAEDIRNKNARTLDQALSLLPGVNIRVGADGTPRIGIRGFRTRHVVLLLNGIPINSAVDQDFNPTLIPTENIAFIKLTSGASSVLYGQGGLGGVINVVTKQGTTGLQGMVSGEFGDHQPYLTKASVSGKKGMFDFLVTGSALDIDGFPLSDDFTPTSEQGTGYRKNSDKERRNFLANFGFNPNKDLSLGLTLNYLQGEWGKPSSVINDPFDPFANNPRYERIDSTEGVSAQLAADLQVTEQLSFRGWTYINWLEEETNRYDNAYLNSFSSRGSFHQLARTTVYGLSVQPKYDMGKGGTVTLSLSAEKDGWSNSGYETIATDTFSKLNDDKVVSLYTTAVQYELSPIEGLGFTAGYGHFWQNRSERRANDFAVNTGVHYDILKSTRLKAAFSRNIRFPAIGDLYSADTGNPELDPEIAYTYEGGVEQKLPFNSSISVTGFYTKAKNLIQTDQATGLSENLAEVKFKGFEVSAATQFMKGLLLRASYTYLDSKDESRAGREELQYTPRDRVTMEAKYDFDFGLSPYASVQYVGNQFFYTKNNVTPVQKMGLNDYVLVNLKVSQMILKDKLTLYVGADNILDENYETSYGFPQAGRYIYGGLEFRL